MSGWHWVHPYVSHGVGGAICVPGQVFTTCPDCRGRVWVRCRDIAAADGVWICPSCGERDPVERPARIRLLAAIVAEEREIAADLRAAGGRGARGG